MNAQYLKQFIKEVLTEAYGIEFGYPIANPRLFLQDEDVEQDVGVGSSIITSKPHIVRVELQDENLTPETRTIEVVAALRGGWFKGKTDEEEKENRMAYTRTMGWIKSMATDLKAVNDPEFMKLLNKSADFLTSYIAKNKKKIDYVVVAESTSTLGKQYAEILTKKLSAKFATLDQTPVISQKSSSDMDVFYSRIKRELKGRFEKQVGHELSDEELQAMPQYKDEFAQYEKDTKSTIKSTHKAGQKAGTQFRIQGTGGRGFRRFIKGGFTLPGAERFAGKTILVVDDNVSEGWTIRELARKVLLSGADDVFGAAVWKWGQPVEIPGTADKRARDKKSKDASVRSGEAAKSVLKQKFDKMSAAKLPFKQSDQLSVGQPVITTSGVLLGKIASLQDGDVMVATPNDGMKKFKRLT